MAGNGNHNTALFWEYDTRLGRRWNIDPKPIAYNSSYLVLNNSPFIYKDILGDYSIVDNKGTIIKHDPKDNDKRVFAKINGKMMLLGELGGKIDVNIIYSNLLKANVKEAKEIYSPWTFKSFVTDKGKWDYKSDPKSIFGIGNDNKTKFLFQGKQMESQDIGNHHFGVVSLAIGIFPRNLILEQAGKNQMSKPGHSKPEWQKYKYVTSYIYTNSMTEFPIKVVSKVMLPPYGDDPRDQYWIKMGFNYFNNQNKH